MEFRQLRYFVAAAEEGNIGAAAKRLHISQPPVTRQIHALEQHLGVLLFERGARGVQLTPAGAAFLEDARRMLELGRTSVDRSRAASRGEIGQLDVGYLGTAIYHSLPVLLHAFTQAAPGATLSLSHMLKTRQIEALRAGTIHVGVARFYAQERGISVEHLHYEKLYIAAGPGIAREVSKDPTLLRLQREPFILFPKEGRPSFADEVIASMRRAGSEPRVVAIVDDVTTALGLVAAGVGVTLVPASVAKFRWPFVRMFELADEHARVPVSMAYMADSRVPVLQTFLEIARRETPSL
ncbi:LysR family transcriptional regulator (plasmid) [Burkholderia sp. KK1]|uniref:LysR-type transcriptional regulator n=1 Tax=Burkholderia sp. M701 TaxID=326454 RepID=V5YQF6_9BURK|nr:LysR family transcriptional regulator [Burkholderia sp. M701]AQH05940.1 LysR family transcriptional regulator [Burkholderia sp. KK1]BAO19171.1 LysR-type transcriptional regulator [Burkholderia sp. M701]